MELFPVTLTTPRLIMRPFAVQDAPELAKKIDDPEIAKFTLYVPHPYSIDDGIQFIEGSTQRRIAGTSLELGIFLMDSGELVGGIGLLKIDREHGSAGLGYWAAKAHWGKGYIVEAVNALMSHAFDTLSLHRVQAMIFAPNARSRRVLEKAGFKKEGTVRECYFKNDAWFDGILFSKLSTDPR